MLARLRQLWSWVRPDGLFSNLAALETFFRASPWLTGLSLVLATIGGLLAPVFMLATGALVQSIRDGTSITAPLLAIAVVFALQRTVDPLREELGHLLWPRLDHHFAARIMTAASAPSGLKELEDPEVLDSIAQARGTLSGFTPGQAAEQFGAMWANRVQALAALAIVARSYWWAALILALVYVIGFNAARWHWDEVAVVVLERSEKLRRSHYLRSLALSSRVAKETRIFDLASWLVDRYRANSLAVLHDVWRKRDEGWLVAGVVFSLIALAEVTILSTVARDTMGGSITLATAVAVSQAVLSAGLLSRYDDPDWGLSEADRSRRVLNALERSTRSGPPTTPAVRQSAEGLPRQAIEFEHVTFGYPGRTTPVLEDFNLRISAGHSLAIVGENGSGKTTLVKLLTRLYEPAAGRISIDGVDLREIAPEAWHRRVSALFQDFARFEMTAYDNVAFGALHAYGDCAGVQRAAADAGVLAVVERLNRGWDTTLSREYQQGAELSGGEWQRLAMARALFGVASGAGLLILDEPTASLDVRGEAEVYDRFLDLTRGVTTIVISHRFSTVRRADRIVVIEHGRVIEDGTHDELVARPNGRYARMYALQASRFAEVDC